MRISGLSWIQLPALVKRTRDHFKKRIADVVPVSGMPEVLLTLSRRGYRMGILTSNTKENVETFLADHELEMFEFIHAPKILIWEGKASQRDPKVSFNSPFRNSHDWGRSSGHRCGTQSRKWILSPLPGASIPKHYWNLTRRPVS